MIPFTVRQVHTSDVIDLRWNVLRPGMPRESAFFDGDDAPATMHFGAYTEDGIAGVSSVYRAPMPGQAGAEEAWQLRGMATHASARGHGLGQGLLRACEDAVREAGGELIWCNARYVAADFYEKHGWAVDGEEFDIPTVGPHFRMWRRL